MGCNCGKGIQQRLAQIAANLEKRGDAHESQELKKNIAQYEKVLRKLKPTKR